MRVPDWWDISKRLRRYLISHTDLIFAYKWTEQCGQWVMVIYKNVDVYKENP